MRSLRWFGLVPSLLFAGVLGGLLAPLPSEALTVTIDGSPVQIATTSAACIPGYNLCSFITPRQYGNWIVGDVSTTNRARIMIGDNSAANSLDLLKMTGITFTPVVTAGTKITTTVVVTHTYNAGGGNPQGNYSWGYGMSGYFDPPGPNAPDENVVGDRLQQSGRGNFGGTFTNVQLGSGIDTGFLATPSAKNLSGSISRTSAATVVQPNCNTGNARCAPTITQTFTITAVGPDKLVMTDSMIAAGGTCRAVDEVIPIPPHLYALMLKLDPNAPNDINQLSAWLKKMGEKYLNKPIQKKLLAYLIHQLDKWLAATVPGTCPEIEGEIEEVLLDDEEGELVAAQAAGAVPAEPGGTITITKNTNQETSDTFTFNIISGESSSTETIPMGGQTSQSIVVTVEPGTYNITEDSLAGWTLTSSSCGEEGQVPTDEIVVEVGGNVNCTFNNKTFISDDYRVINVDGGMTWSEARAQAQALAQTLGGVWDLADIRSQEEQSFIQTLLPPNPTGIPGVHDYWIGGRQVGEDFGEPGGNWRWDRDNVQFYNGAAIPGVYSNWGTGEPNNLGGSENHLTVDNRYGWGWNDLNADGGTGFPKGYIAKRFP